jgi:hypothetical protein
MKCSCKNIDSVVLGGAEILMKRLAAPGSPGYKEMLSQVDELAKECGYERDANGHWIHFPKQEKVLGKLDSWEILKEHDDGDLTLSSNLGEIIVTTDGKVFHRQPAP